MERLRSIISSRESGSVDGFGIHPTAAQCVLAVLDKVDPARRELILEHPVKDVVRSCVAATMNADTAERYVEFGCQGQSKVA